MNNKSLKKFSWPQHPSKEFLNRIYDSHIPPTENFSAMIMDRDSLNRFLWPFRIDPRDFGKYFGFNLDMPLDYFFESQLHDFVEIILENDDNPYIGITKRIVKRMGRTGCLYRHGFQPKSPNRLIAESKSKIKKLESEIEDGKKILKKRKQFEKERDIIRQESWEIYNSLHIEDQHYLKEEFEYAQEDEKIKNRGGTFDDFLIFKFRLKIGFFEEIKKNYKIRIRLKEIISKLKGIENDRRANQIDFPEFAKFFRATSYELNELDGEL